MSENGQGNRSVDGPAWPGVGWWLFAIVLAAVLVGLIMFAYLLGPPVFGWYGIFLGPLLMVVIAQLLEFLFPGMVGIDRHHTSVRTTEETRADDEASVELVFNSTDGH